MDMKLELVPVPVTDFDRAKAFYADQIGFTVDVDMETGPGMRFIQLTPPGSACSIMMGTHAGDRPHATAPGTVSGLHLVVADLDAARKALEERGVAVGDVVEVGGGVRYAWFDDPDGNSWALQEMSWRTGDTF